MAQHHYFHYFQGKGDIKGLIDSHRPFRVVSKDKFYKYLKNLFFDYTYSKWKVKKYKNFVIDNSLDHDTCHKVLFEFSNTAYIETVTGSKGFKTFVKSLEKYGEEIDISKVIVKEDPKGFLEKMIEINSKHLKFSNKKLIHYIAVRFDTGWSESTIKSYLYEVKYSK